MTKEFIPNIVPLGTGMYKVTEVQSSAIILEKKRILLENR